MRNVFTGRECTFVWVVLESSASAVLRRVRDMRDHMKLRAFELADELALAVYGATKGFLKDEVFGLRSQLRRAAVSVASNIVEGCARYSKSDYIRFLDMAYGSAREVEYQVSLSFRLGYMNSVNSEALRMLSAETSKVLNGLIRALRKQ